MIQRLAATFLL